jgi:hypothetical protein
MRIRKDEHEIFPQEPERLKERTLRIKWRSRRGCTVFVPIDEDNNIRHLDLIPSLEKPRDGLCMIRTSRIRLSGDATRIVEQNFQDFTNRVKARIL